MKIKLNIRDSKLLANLGCSIESYMLYQKACSQGKYDNADIDTPPEEISASDAIAASNFLLAIISQLKETSFTAKEAEELNKILGEINTYAKELL